MLIEAVWMMTPMRRMTEPKVILCLRPNLSLTYGTTGIAMTAPMLKAALMRPRRAPFGLSKSEIYGISVMNIDFGWNLPTIEPWLHSLQAIHDRPIVA